MGFADLRATLRADGVIDVDGEIARLEEAIGIGGQVDDPARIAQDIASITRALGVFGTTVTAAQVLEVLQYGRRASPPLAEEFSLGTAGTLLPVFGSLSGYIAAVANFRRTVGGDLTIEAVDALNSLGLITDCDAKLDGYATLDGYAIAGAAVASVDPDRWTRDWLVRALRVAGVDTPDAVREQIGRIFTGTAAHLVCTLAAEATRIEAHRAALCPRTDLAEAEHRLAVIEQLVAAIWPVTRVVHTPAFHQASQAAMLPHHLTKVQIDAATAACAAGKHLADLERSRLAAATFAAP